MNLANPMHHRRHRMFLWRRKTNLDVVFTTFRSMDVNGPGFEGKPIIWIWTQVHRGKLTVVRSDTNGKSETDNTWRLRLLVDLTSVSLVVLWNSESEWWCSSQIKKTRPVFHWHHRWPSWSNLNYRQKFHPLRLLKLKKGVLDLSWFLDLTVSGSVDRT